MQEYILSITAAALLCAVLMGLTTPTSPQGKLIRLVGSCYVALAVVTPMKNGLLRDYFPKLSHYRADAAAITQRAEEEAAATQKNIIRNQTQAYIQNKADALGCQLSVTVTLSSDAPYRPIAAVLQGNVSPSAKAELTQWIRENFQLTGEVLTWRDS